MLRRAIQRHLEGLRALGVDVVPRAASGAASDDPAAHAATKAAQLTRLSRQVEGCRRCRLYEGATHGVPGDGNPDAALVFVGEAPGREEDLQGKPFVGAAGKLLTKMIQAMGFRREDVYICNVVKHRPPGNRVPLPDEMEACRPYLETQLALIHPKVICALGAVATKALLGPHVSITKIRGEVRDYGGIPVVPTFHPAYLLRYPAAKKLAWQDLRKIARLLKAVR